MTLMIALIPISPRAEDPATTAKTFHTSFAGWVQSTGVRTAALSLRYNDASVGTFTVSSGAVAINAGTMVDLASLSKAITGVCMAALVNEGRITYDSMARDILALPKAAPITIAALLSHSSGLERDRTQRFMAEWRDDPTARWDEVTAKSLTPSRLKPGKPAYFYSNENYAVLGSVIEKVTGEPYEAACRKRVLDPAGVKGVASDRFAAYLPWGGWQMSLPDYAAFTDYAFGKDGLLTADLGVLPQAKIDGPVSYGMGMTQRQVEDGRNIWHFGALCFEDGPNFGSYVVHFTNGWTVVAWYDACVSWPQMMQLDAAIARVAHSQD